MKNSSLKKEFFENEISPILMNLPSCFANQLTGLYMVEILAFDGLSIFSHKRYPAGQYMLTVIDKKLDQLTKCV